MFHTDWPWLKLRKAYHQMRKALFTVERPPGKYVRVSLTPDEVVELYGQHSWAPNWEFSYNKRGEIINLAQITYEERDINGETYEWWQSHVRGWEAPDGQIDLGGHWEPEPTEHPHAHLDGVGFNRARGMKNIKQQLDDYGVTYEVIDYPAAPQDS